MSITTYDRSIGVADAAGTKPARKPFLTRLYDAISQAQQRRAEREIGRYLTTRGSLTDEVEREIMRRLSGIGPR